MQSHPAGSSTQTAIRPWQTYRRLLGHVKPFRLAFYVAIFGNILYAVVDASLIKLLQPLLDDGFSDHNELFIQWIPWIILIIFFIRGIANFCSSHFMGWVSRQVVMSVRQNMFGRLLRLPARYFDGHTSGEILSKLTYDVEQVANASTEAVEVVVRETFTALGLLIVMLSISWSLTLILIFTVPMMMIIMRYASKRLREINARVQASMGGVTQIVQEAIDGHREVKMYHAEDYEMQRFSDQIEYNRRQEMKVITTSSVSVPLVQLVGALALAGTIYWATTATSLDGQAMTAGAFAAMITAMLALLKPIKQLTKINSTIQRGIAAASSVFAFLDEPLEPSRTGVAPRFEHVLSIRDLSVAFDGERHILKNISLSVRPGEKIAFVGPSGSGKTTLMQCVLQFYPYMGVIEVDGVVTDAMDLVAYRGLFSVVSQHVVLFNDTIYNNIAYARKDATTEEIEAVARLAYAHDFIEASPLGYQTVIGENGMKLSGGQRQRIAIARALLKRAPILILDEATSALDVASEKHIQSALDCLVNQSTTLIIAHRLSTIEGADRIVLMQDGVIEEVGPHKALLAADGLYARLWKTQQRVLMDDDEKTAV